MALGGGSSGLEKGNVTPILKKGRKEDAGTCRLVSLTPAPGKVMEQTVLETVTKHMKNKKGAGSSEHGFAKDNLCLASLTDFCDDTLWTRGGQGMSYTLNLARSLTQSPIVSLSLNW